jgi:taurine dioxygenase
MAGNSMISVDAPRSAVGGRELRFAPLTGALGAETDDQLLGRLTPAVMAEVRAALAEYQVLFFRHQPVDQRLLYTFASQFGALRTIERDGRGNPIKPQWPDFPALSFVKGRANEWHTDLTFMDPNRYTVLECVTAPPFGGDTTWCSMTKAFDALSPRMQRYIIGLDAVHTGLKVGEPARSEVRPVVRAHPETGAPILYVSRTYTSHIRGIPWRESAAILDFLYAHAEQAHFSCRWRWAPGDVVIWDNSCTMHVASDDYGDEASRDIYHISVLGDEPTPYGG